MGILDIFKRKENRNFYPTQLFSTNSTSYLSAETNPTVVSCVNLIANTLGNIKFSLYARQKGGGRVPAVFHPLFNVVKSPSVEETPTLFYSTMIRFLLERGNAYIFKLRNKNGDIVSLSLINPDSITVTRTDLGKKIYSIDKNTYTDNEVLHIPYYGSGYNGTIGKSPIQTARQLINLDNALFQYINDYFSNSLGKRVIFNLGDNWKNKNREDIKKTIMPYLKRLEAGEPFINPPDVKLDTLDVTSNAESDLRSLKMMIEQEITRAFGIPYEMLSGENKYNSLEQRQISFLKECIEPLGNHIESSFDKMLSPIDSNLYFRYDYKTLLQTDTKTSIETLDKELKGGIISINEYREKLEMNSIGEIGDYYMFPAGYYPLTMDNINAFFAQSKNLLNAPSTDKLVGSDKI